ncbi:MAG: selenide, water dikinase SelD [Gemmatimonadetes bacterium]|nr:selenide, water dikinase SelD [Gemmatimonadota bacterium]
MNQTIPFKKDLVLVGGGHSHVQVIRMLAMKKALGGIRVTLISDESTACYSGMLPGCLAGLYRPDEMEMELRPLCNWAGVRFVRARMAGLDPALQQVHFDDGRPPLAYDVLSINIGSIPRGMDTPGVREHAVPTRPLGLLLKRVHQFEENHRSDGRPLRIVIAGGGAAGVELAFAMHSRWQERFAPVQITLVDSQATLLTGHRPRVAAIIGRYLEEKGIECLTGLRVAGVDETAVHFEDHPSLPCDFLLWATGGAPPGLLKDTNLETCGAGFIRVRPTLQAMGFDNVFAAGDCIEFPSRSLPKSGVYAVREGPVLARNIHAWLEHRSLVPYRPQASSLALLMTGTRNAVASRRHASFHGPWVWRLKDWIDRRWMRKFDPALLPPMDPADSGSRARDAPSDREAHLTGEEAGEGPEVSAMRCAGCGAKVGSTVLTGVLDELEVFDREDVRIGLHDADDAAQLVIPPGRSLVQTVDGFRAFTGDLHLFGRIALVHAASDLYAMGAEPHSALVTVTLPYAEKPLVANDLRQLMGGIAEEARRLGVTLLGGHTSEGTETAVSVTMNGLTGSDAVFRKGGLRPGDGLILTKPVGTGVILAADMHLKAKGSWVDEVFEGMLRSNAKAASILAQAGIPSVTDVTGFGLAGHLVEMLEASGTGAEIEIDGIPLYDGAADCVVAGVESTLAPSNREHLRKRWQVESGPGAEDALLFDPQTSGGLLAGVPAARIDEVLVKLRDAGYAQAACIGRVTDRKRHLKIR